MDRTAAGGGGGGGGSLSADLPIMHNSDRYELVKDIGSGNFGVARLMRDKTTNQLVAVKYIERGEKVSSSFLSLISPYSIFNSGFCNLASILYNSLY